MFLGSDDILMNDAYETLYDEIISENVDIVSGFHTLEGINPSDGCGCHFQIVFMLTFKLDKIK